MKTDFRTFWMSMIWMMRYCESLFRKFMKMKNLLVFSFFLLTLIKVSAQSQETLDKIEAAKIGLITERLGLTPEQAEKFWPIYKEYSGKQREIAQEFQALKRSINPETATEEENKKILDRGHQLRERQLDLDRNYSERMQQVITNRQLLSLRKAEDDFKQMLMDRIKQQNQQQEQLRDNRQRNDAQMNQRKNN